jgi:hypothetical protein
MESRRCDGSWWVEGWWLKREKLLFLIKTLRFEFQKLGIIKRIKFH